MPSTTAYNTLCTPFDVTRFSPVNPNMDSTRFCNAIKREEETLFNVCFGRSFYKALLADKIAYTYTDFAKGVVYAVNSVVLYFGLLYKCIQLTTGVETPNDTSYFIEAPRFTTTVYQTLFTSYLAELIAFYVAANSIINASIDFSAQGAIRKKGDTFDAATSSEIGLSKQQLLDSATITQRNMNVFILENKTDYPLYKPILDSCTTNCNTRKNWGFNV